MSSTWLALLGGYAVTIRSFRADWACEPRLDELVAMRNHDG
jgi:hypothetical protein